MSASDLHMHVMYSVHVYLHIQEHAHTYTHGKKPPNFCMLIIPELGKPRQDDQCFKASLGYIEVI